MQGMLILLNGLLKLVLPQVEIAQFVKRIPGIRSQGGRLLEAGLGIGDPAGSFVGAGKSIERGGIPRVDVQSALKFLQSQVVVPH